MLFLYLLSLFSLHRTIRVVPAVFPANKQTVFFLSLWQESDYSSWWSLERVISSNQSVHAVSITLHFSITLGLRAVWCDQNLTFTGWVILDHSNNNIYHNIDFYWKLSRKIIFILNNHVVMPIFLIIHWIFNYLDLGCTQKNKSRKKMFVYLC